MIDDTGALYIKDGSGISIADVFKTVVVTACSVIAAYTFRANLILDPCQIRQRIVVDLRRNLSYN